MTGYATVVVALDFDASTSRVLEHAARAVRPGGLLDLVHVLEWVPTVVEGAFAGYGSQRDMRALADVATKKLAEWAARCGVPGATSEVVQGDAALSLLEVAARRGADLLVVGAGARERALGRVMERVLRGARCPVLVVR